jgi:type IV secretion system protein VirB6
MGLISEIGTTIDTALISYAQTIFTSVASPIAILLNSVALIALMFIALNHILQFKPINYSIYLHWGLRWLLIYSFATIWQNFQGIYNIFMEVPSDYSALLLKAVAFHIRTLRTDILDPSLITDTYSGMDEFAHAVVWMAYDFFRDTSITDIGKSIMNVFCGVVILIIGGLFTASSAIIVIIGKVGFALAISLAPLALVGLMMEQTKGYFQSWLQFAVGFAILPLLTTGLMSVVLYIGGEILANSGAGSDNKAAYFPFVFVVLAALFLLFQLPTMASTLAGASVATASGRAPLAAASMVKNTVTRNASRAYHAGQRLRDAASVMKGARDSGASPGRIAWAAISGMRQSTMARQSRRDQRMSDRMPGMGSRGVPSPDKYKNMPEQG